MHYTDGLNEMQKKAVMTTEGAVLMLAGAGSGKTKALTCRIARLVENGVSPFSILAITFTNKAAREMRERVNEIIGGKAQSIMIATFHSACLRFLRSDIEKLNSSYTRDFTIYDTDDQRAVIKECVSRLKIDDKIFKPAKVLSIISAQKDELAGCEEFARNAEGNYYSETVAKIYTEYQALLRKNNALDFDDLIFLTLRLFTENKEVLEKYRERFKYILVDEYQDTNTAQYRLVKALAERSGNLCVVGDDDQSIYGWRGANVKNIEYFEKDFRESITIKLEQNYRSTKNILDIANAVIVRNSGRKSKKLWTEAPSGEKPCVYEADNEHEEALWLAGEAERLVAGGAKYSDMAVLYRTNAQSRVLEDVLVKKNIPYRVFGGLRFYERMEIKDLLAYLRVIVNPSDDVSARRVINTPKRAAGKVFISKIMSVASDEGLSFIEALKYARDNKITKIPEKINDFLQMLDELSILAKSADIAGLIEKLLDESGYIEMLGKEYDEFEENSRVENLQEFISKAAEFDMRAKDYEEAYAEEYDGSPLSDFLAEVALVADIDNYAEDEDAVILMTIHSSKGLEFPVVFLTGLEEGLFPGWLSINGGQDKLEEERRLFYVGVTRAKKTLYLTRAKRRMTKGITEYSSPSRFLKETPAELTKIITGGRRAAAERVNPFADKRRVSVDIHEIERYSAELYKNILMPKGSDIKIDFAIGDRVKHKKFGMGDVRKIALAGKDYEVTIEFDDHGSKKLMAFMSGIKKA